MGTQEILHVCIHLYLKEKSLNEYYLHVISHLAASGSNSRTFQISAKTAVWDRIDLYTDPETSAESSEEINRFVSLIFHLAFVGQTLTLGIFKNLDFSDLGKKAENLLKFYLKKVAVYGNSENLSSILNKTKLEKARDVKTLTTSLAMFIDFFMIDDRLEKKMKQKLEILSGNLKAHDTDDGTSF